MGLQGVASLFRGTKQTVIRLEIQSQDVQKDNSTEHRIHRMGAAVFVLGNASIGAYRLHSDVEMAILPAGCHTTCCSFRDA